MDYFEKAMYLSGFKWAVEVCSWDRSAIEPHLFWLSGGNRGGWAKVPQEDFTRGVTDGILSAWGY